MLSTDAALIVVLAVHLLIFNPHDKALWIVEHLPHLHRYLVKVKLLLNQRCWHGPSTAVRQGLLTSRIVLIADLRQLKLITAMAILIITTSALISNVVVSFLVVLLDKIATVLAHHVGVGVLVVVMSVPPMESQV